MPQPPCLPGQTWHHHLPDPTDGRYRCGYGQQPCHHHHVTGSHSCIRLRGARDAAQEASILWVGRGHNQSGLAPTSPTGRDMWPLEVRNQQ